jgi:hypothetical protein
MSERNSETDRAPGRATDPMEAAGQIDPSGFRAQLDTTFRVEVDAVRIPLQLVEVVDERSSGGFQWFSLLFHGPSERPLPQGTHSLHHDALGELMLFLVPVVGSNGERIVYEACFSRLVPARPAP